jgi:hypothetical protein
VQADQLFWVASEKQNWHDRRNRPQWGGGHGWQHGKCTAIDVDGRCHEYECNAQLPALCSQSATPSYTDLAGVNTYANTSAAWQIAHSVGPQTLIGYRDVSSSALEQAGLMLTRPLVVDHFPLHWCEICARARAIHIFECLHWCDWYGRSARSRSGVPTGKRSSVEGFSETATSAKSACGARRPLNIAHIYWALLIHVTIPPIGSQQWQHRLPVPESLDDEFARC